MLIRELFLSDVTRDIPPVVYFHEQRPDKLAARCPSTSSRAAGPRIIRTIAECRAASTRSMSGSSGTIAAELDKAGGPELPNAWISGFYGSGKSSFAKLLGLSLDGVALPDGGSLAEAWLQRDTSPKSAELREAWRVLRQKIDPLAVVFDIGGIARDNEHIHAASRSAGPEAARLLLAPSPS